LIKKWAPRELGRYRCRSCKETLDTSVSGMERHIEAHLTHNVTKLYRNPVTLRFHPGEQYYRPGGFVSCPHSVLHCFVINGKRFERGDKWECQACKATLSWKVGETGQRGARVVEKIEKHIANLIAHGNCDTPSKEELKKKAQKLVEKARKESESSN
jgi:transposase-like protein